MRKEKTDQPSAEGGFVFSQAYFVAKRQIFQARLAETKEELDRVIDEIAAIRLPARPKRGIVSAMQDPRQKQLGLFFGVMRDLRSIDEALAYLGKRPAPAPGVTAPTYRSNVRIYLTGLESLAKAVFARCAERAEPDIMIRRREDHAALQAEIHALADFLAGLPKPALHLAYRVLTHI